MSTESRDKFIHRIFTIVAPYVDTLSHGFSLGLDRRWRKKAVALSGIRQGDRVLDICAGTGELAFQLLPAVGGTGSITATDFCENMLEIAKKKKGGNHANMTFLMADAKALPFPSNAFDAVTVGFGMRNIPDTILALKEIWRVLKPGGRFVCLELTKPQAPVLGRLYSWYLSRFMPFISNLVMKSSAPYLYLPRSIEAFYQPPEFREVIKRNGFGDVAVVSLTLGIATVYRASKRG
ncbi:MAG: bifunctional demethylmenaquinone methyltransferase/2-methoxy-6-polyprenyl-1,4-benzoquinol methylase UbiE [Nitrospirota bacterium]